MFELGQFDPDSWVQLISGAGLGAAIAVFLLWKLMQDREIEKKRLDSLETFIQDKLLNLIKEESSRTQECLEVIRNSAVVMSQNTIMVERCLNTLDIYEKQLADKHTLNEELLKRLKELNK